MYAYFKRLDYFSTECLYAPFAARGFARDFVKDLEVSRGVLRGDQGSIKAFGHDSRPVQRIHQRGCPAFFLAFIFAKSCWV